MASRKLLLEAARLMNEDADLMAESCAVQGKRWQCTDCEKDRSGRCKAQLDHAERMRTVIALKQAA